jgi:HK97 family phage portal protein
MGLIDNIRRAFGGQTITNKFNEAFYWGTQFTRYSTESKTYLEQGYNSNSVVYSVISQQATKLSSIPIKFKEIKDDNSRKQLEHLQMATKGDYKPSQLAKKAELEIKAYMEQEYGMPLDRPNANQSWYEFIALSETFLNLDGNIYWYVVAPDAGMDVGVPMAIYCLPSHLTQIVLKPNANTLSIENPIDYYIMQEGNMYVRFEEENVIHVKYSNPNYDEDGSHLYGMSRLRSALMNIQASNEALELNNKALKSGGAFGFITGVNNAPLTSAQAQELKDRMREMRNDDRELGKIAGMSGTLDFVRLSLTADELKPFDYLNYDQKQICNVLGWSDKLLNNDDGAKYDNYNLALKSVISNKIMPDGELIMDAFNNQFLTRFRGLENVCAMFDYSALPEMQQDYSEMVGYMSDLLDRGVINRNTFRVALGYEMVEDESMEAYTTTQDVLTIEESINNGFSLDDNRAV